jgi:2-polyprenyl-3-methyl-5-hydroxy-6-metoxy-1,4-benzoquinol methylase
MAGRHQHWNHNIHYYPDVLRALPEGVTRVLDVGCGDGTLARQLSAKAAQVMALDRSGHILQVAAAADAGTGVRYLQADFLAAPLRPESVDAVVSMAALHHMDPPAALSKMRDLLRPGGRLFVMDVAKSSSVADLPAEAAGFVVHRLHKWQHGISKSDAPQLPPQQTYAEIRRICRVVLPGSAFRRHALWRYSITWTKPAN